MDISSQQLHTSGSSRAFCTLQPLCNSRIQPALHGAGRETERIWPREVKAAQKGGACTVLFARG